MKLDVMATANQLLDQDNQSVPLTSMEFDLLKAFAGNPNKVLNRDQLLSLSLKPSYSETVYNKEGVEKLLVIIPIRL